MHITKEKGNKDNSNYIKYKGTKVGLGIGGVGGAIISGVAVIGGIASLPAIGMGVGIATVGAVIGTLFN